METFDRIFEQFKVAGQDLGAKVKDLIHEGNVRRIHVKDERGNTFMEIPLTVATLGVIAAPVVAAIGAIAGMAAHFTVVVEREPEPSHASSSAGPTDASVGATEDNVDMADTVNMKAEEAAGTGESDALGG